jgi:serine protease Do
MVKKIVSDLVEFGTVQRAYIGINPQDIDAKFAESKNLKQLKGVYVNGISAGGSAQDAGIEEGDVITKVQDVAVASVSELQEQVSRYRPGDKISVALVRNNKEMNLPLTLKTFDNTTKLVKKSEIVKSSTIVLGAEFSTLDFDQLAELHTENGVRIEKIGSGKLAQVGIQQGFIITSIDRKKVSTAQDVQKLLERTSGMVIIEGFYANGMRASYSFNL